MAAGWQSRWRPGDTGKLAKAAGATPAQVRAWMSGEVQPTTAQALAVLDALPFPAVGFPALTEAAS